MKDATIPIAQSKQQQRADTDMSDMRKLAMFHACFVTMLT